MGPIRPAVVVIAAAMTSPALYHGLVTGDLDLTSALIRFVIAVPVAAVMVAGLRIVTAGYGKTANDPAPGTPSDAEPPRRST